MLLFWNKISCYNKHPGFIGLMGIYMAVMCRLVKEEIPNGELEAQPPCAMWFRVSSCLETGKSSWQAKKVSCILLS